jgi:copper(I)-binding protein
VNRALRAATMGALLLSPIALTACSAGQVTQTATQNRDKVGAEAQVGSITLRQVTLEHPDEGRYEAGDDAALNVAVINSGNEADTLVGIEGEGFDGVLVSGQASAAPAVPGSPSASAPAAGGAAATTTAPAAGATTAAPTASSRIDVPVPGNSTVFIGGDSDLTVQLAGLTDELTAGQSVELTFTFQQAGDVTVRATVANPDRVLPREEGFDFHTEEGSEEQDTEVAGGGNPESGG